MTKERSQKIKGMNKIKASELSTRKTSKGFTPICAITAYDYPTARLVDEVGVDLILVGDSLGMVVLGFPDTTYVTLDHMKHHTAAVSRGAQETLIVSDLPIDTYRTPEEALTNARVLIESGADAVKLEGGECVLPQISRLIEEGIPVIGHLGMLPQRIREERRYNKKGRDEAQAAQLVSDAKALEKAGVLAIVLESIIPTVAKQMTNEVDIPMIGIGCGKYPCDGEIAVLSDVVGSYPWFVPPFAVKRADVSSEIRSAVLDYKISVHNA